MPVHAGSSSRCYLMTSADARTPSRSSSPGHKHNHGEKGGGGGRIARCACNWAHQLMRLICLKGRDLASAFMLSASSTGSPLRTLPSLSREPSFSCPPASAASKVGLWKPSSWDWAAMDDCRCRSLPPAPSLNGLPTAGLSEAMSTALPRGRCLSSPPPLFPGTIVFVAVRRRTSVPTRCD